MPQPIRVCAEARTVEIVEAVRSTCLSVRVLVARTDYNYERVRALLSRYRYGLASSNQVADHDVLVTVARAAGVLLDSNEHCGCSRCTARRGP